VKHGKGLSKVKYNVAYETPGRISTRIDGVQVSRSQTGFSPIKALFIVQCLNA
jgi:hypothetical protein